MEELEASSQTVLDTPTRAGAAWQVRFLDTLRETGNVRRACAEAKVARSMAYYHRDREPEFAALWNTALEDACDELEGEAWRRGVEGVDEPVYWQGKVCGHVKRYSDQLLMQLLKAHRPEKFRERLDTRHSGPGGGPIQIDAPAYDLSKLSDEELDQFRRIAAKLEGDARELPPGEEA